MFIEEHAFGIKKQRQGCEGRGGCACRGCACIGVGSVVATGSVAQGVVIGVLPFGLSFVESFFD